MAGVYAVTGNLGAGKTLVCVGKIRDYLARGRRVATNLDLRLELLAPSGRYPTVVRLPDYPHAEQLRAIGVGNPSRNEDLNGLLVLDEAGGWLNSRGWQDKDRHAVIEFLMHARKLGWDVFLIVQSVNLIDKQVRDAFVEHLVRCRRLDRFSWPYIGAIIQWIGGKLRLPQVHIANVFYGTAVGSACVERWYYRGRDLWATYDTRQRFNAEGTGLASMLTPGKSSWLDAREYSKRQRVGKWLRWLYDLLHPMSDTEATYRAFRMLDERPTLFCKPHFVPQPPRELLPCSSNSSPLCQFSAQLPSRPKVPPSLRRLAELVLLPRRVLRRA